MFGGYAFKHLSELLLKEILRLLFDFTTAGVVLCSGCKTPPST